MLYHKKFNFPSSILGYHLRNSCFVMDGSGLLNIRKRALNAELAEVRLAARRLRSKEARRRSSFERAWLISDMDLRTSLAIYMLSSYAHEPAVAYLRRIGRQRRWPWKEDTELKSLLENEFLAASVDELSMLSEWDATIDNRVMRVAADFAWQWRLVTWTNAQNLKGIAPPTSLVLDEWARRRAEVPSHLRPCHWGNVALASARMRALRWRRRFEGRVGGIQAQEHIPIDVMQDKALLDHVQSFTSVLLHNCQSCFIIVIRHLRPRTMRVPPTQYTTACATPTHNPRDVAGYGRGVCVHTAPLAASDARQGGPPHAAPALADALQVCDSPTMSGLDFLAGIRTEKRDRV